MPNATKADGCFAAHFPDPASRENYTSDRLAQDAESVLFAVQVHYLDICRIESAIH